MIMKALLLLVLLFSVIFAAEEETTPNEKNENIPPEKILQYAVLANRIDIVKKFIKLVKNVNYDVDDDGWKLLHLASSESPNEETVKLLLQYGADVNAGLTDGLTALHAATRAGEEKIAEILFEQGHANINQKDIYGRTPLYAAAIFDQVNMTKFLLSHGANVNLLKKDGQSALHAAALKGNAEIIEILIKNGAEINLESGDGATPLHMAAYLGNEAAAKTLLKYGADYSIVNNDGLTPLDMAIEQDKTKIVEILKEAEWIGDLFGLSSSPTNNDGSWKSLADIVRTGNVEAVEELLMENGTNVNEENIRKLTPLHYAAILGNAPIAEILIKYGANINHRDGMNGTPLFYATYRGNEQVIDTLLKNGAEVNEVRDGATALHGASQNGFLTIVKMLIKRGANVNAQNHFGFTPTHSAAAEGRKEVVEYLVKNGADLTIRGNEGLSPLHHAAFTGQDEIIEFLVKSGAVINLRSNTRGTPFHLSAAKNHVKAVETFLKLGMNVDVLDTAGYSPLHAASKNGSLEIMDVLIKNGADVNLDNRNKETPLSLASRYGHLEAVKKLLEYNVDINTQNIKGTAPLHNAIFIESNEMVDYLIEKGAKVSQTDFFGWTPLHFASTKHHLPMEYIIEKLNRHGADCNIKNDDGETPLHLAAIYGQEKAIVALLRNNPNSTSTERTPIDVGNRTAVNVNIQNGEGATALHIATAFEQKTSIRVLLENNADPGIKDHQGRTPIDIAVITNNEELYDMLLSVSGAVGIPLQKVCESFGDFPIQPITGGEPIERNYFPWLVALGRRDRVTGFSFHCIGTIISEFFVLTAAHCVTTKNPPTVIRLQQSNLLEDSDIKAANRRILEIFVNPNYVPTTRLHDIALIRVLDRIHFTQEVKPACLHTDIADLDSDKELIASNWHTTSGQIDLTSDPFASPMYTVSVEECNQTLLKFAEESNKSYSVLQDGISLRQYCAWDRNSKGVECEGIGGGGPLQVFSEEDSMVRIVGVASFGISCDKSLPTVYTRVVNYLHWIQRIVWPIRDQNNLV